VETGEKQNGSMWSRALPCSVGPNRSDHRRRGEATYPSGVTGTPELVLGSRGRDGLQILLHTLCSPDRLSVWDRADEESLHRDTELPDMRSPGR
jgi:hypothetical protein